MRKRGISTIISCQNEEPLIAASILSFLRLSDEIIVVDNGSTDRTKEIAQEVAQAFPRRIQFFDAPHLKHLYENRQYGFERSRYRWIVRADSDYVCYTRGEFDCLHLRNQLLSRPRVGLPTVIRLPHPNLRADFWHTVREDRPMGRHSVVGGGDPRVYFWYPGMKFVRLGRWEGANLPRRFVKEIRLDRPVWMHCDVKSDRNYLFRSERTNWRELGDFITYPTLESYIKKVVLPRYGVGSIEEAAQINLERDVLTYFTPYNPDRYLPYPDLVKAMIREDSGYLVRRSSSVKYYRTYNGPPNTSKMIDLARQMDL